MTGQSKPLLHNGYCIEENCTVVNRIERCLFTDIYLLSDKRAFYLFTDLLITQLPSRSEIYDLKKINVGDVQYIGVIVNNHSHEMLVQIREDLSTTRGFDCVAGMNDLKALLFNDVISPLLKPEKYKKFKLSLPNGILLYGPPGCGKTFIVKKLSEELNYNFMDIKHSDVASPYIHGGVGKISKIFEIAKLNAPSIVFIDEIEGLVPKRENIEGGNIYKQEEINELLMQFNDAGDNHILVVGASNRPNLIDTAILRSGRMDKRIYVPPPDHEARKELFKIYLKDIPHSKHIDFNNLANKTEYIVCSDIELIVTEAAREAVKNELESIDEKMINAIIDQFCPSISENDILYYRQFASMERW